MLGTALLAAAVLALLVPLTEGRTLGWPVWSWILLALAAPAAATFYIVEGRLERDGRHPIVPPTLLRLRGMRRGLLITMPFFAGFGTFMFVSALTLQGGAGFSALRSGLALVPLGVAFLGASLATARLTARFGSRVLSVGAVLQGVGLLGLAATFLARVAEIDPLNLAPAMAVVGLGQGSSSARCSDSCSAGAGGARGRRQRGRQHDDAGSLALGVASLGSLFLSLSATGSLGYRDAFVTVLLVQTVVAAVVAVAGWTLTRPVRLEQVETRDGTARAVARAGGLSRSGQSISFRSIAQIARRHISDAEDDEHADAQQVGPAVRSRTTAWRTSSTH